MTSRGLFLAFSAIALVAAVASLGQAPGARSPVTQALTQPGDARTALAAARAEQSFAAARGAELERQAALATEAVDKTRRQAAALAARIQQAEAGIAASAARIVLIERRRAALRASLAERQEPVVRLTGALQLLGRRPLVLGMLRPGTLQDMVHLRAVLETMLPEVRRRTADLRAGIERSGQFQREANAEQARLKAGETTLGTRRNALAVLESRQRLARRAVRGEANREADRVLALGEQARDLGSLVSELEDAGQLRRRLAALPGPVPRPARPGDARVLDDGGTFATGTPALAYILPVSGSVIAGFGGTSRGITLAPRPGAQVVAPAAGRVAFAGRYEGYGRIVILEHDGGWTTLVTDLAQVSPTVGDALVQGAPLGVAGPGQPRLTIELRKDGVPVDILAMVRG